MLDSSSFPGSIAFLEYTIIDEHPFPPQLSVKCVLMKGIEMGGGGEEHEQSTVETMARSSEYSDHYTHEVKQS